MLTAFRTYLKKRDSIIDNLAVHFESETKDHFIQDEFNKALIRKLAIIFDENPILRDTWNECLDSAESNISIIAIKKILNEKEV